MGTPSTASLGNQEQLNQPGTLSTQAAGEGHPKDQPGETVLVAAMNR